MEDATLSHTPADSYGYRLLSWEVDEYPRHERSRTWFIVAGIIGAALLVYAVVTANFLFAVIVLMLGVIILLTTFKEPQRVEVHITTMGIVVGNTFYPYKDVKDFSIVYQPPQTKLLYVGLSSLLHPLLSIPLEEMDPNQVR